MRRPSSLPTLTAFLALQACAVTSEGPRSRDAGCETGTERCACYRNDTCDRGLTCLSDLCVDTNDSDAVDAGGPLEPDGSQSDADAAPTTDPEGVAMNDAGSPSPDVVTSDAGLDGPGKTIPDAGENQPTIETTPDGGTPQSLPQCDASVEQGVCEAHGDAGIDPVDSCDSILVSYERELPTAMLLVDRSTSMFSPQVPPYVGGSPAVGQYPDRWEALRAAVNQLEPYADEVQFGGMTFTGFRPENGDGSCPSLQQTPSIALDNFDEVRALLPPSADAIPPAKADSPTAEAMVAATAALAAVPSNGPKHLVLLTDGTPEMCGYLDMGVYCGADGTIAAAQAAYAQGIETLVIGIGFDPGDAVGWDAAQYMMNAVAYAGQGFAVPPPTGNHLSQYVTCLSGEARVRGVEEPADLYTGDNWRLIAQATYGAAGTTFGDELYHLPGDNDLGAQLSQVVEGVRTCSFEMADNVLRAQAGKGAVQLQLADGTTQDLVYGDANGWDLDATRDDLVVVQGTACAQVQDQSVVSGVKIEFPCEIRIPKAR